MKGVIGTDFYGTSNIRDLFTRVRVMGVWGKGKGWPSEEVRCWRGGVGRIKCSLYVLAALGSENCDMGVGGWSFFSDFARIVFE
jgi:hypothetical protein